MAAVNLQHDGLLVLAEGEAPVLADVVLVHGLRGDRILTWTRDDVCWPRDFLPQDLTNVRIMSWGYDSSISGFGKSSSQNSIFGHATTLLNDLSYVRLKNPEDTRPIIFIGHNLGGLVIKEALLRSAECWETKQHPRLGSLQKYTKGVIFLGTPHRGSDKAHLAQTLSSIVSVVKKPNEKLQRTLDLDSDVLERQRISFAAQFKDLPTVCFFEEHPTPELGIVVSQTSACMDGYNTTSISIPDTHAGICKYSDKTNTGYRRTVGELTIMVMNISITIAEDSLILRENAAEVILRSLAFPGMNERLNEIDDAHPETFKWLLEKPDLGFIEWLERGSGLFWLSGKAASDEYDGDHIDIVHMLEKHVPAATPSEGGMKVCISSRPLQVLESAFSDYPRIRLQDLTSKDIELYVSDNLKANKQMQTMRRTNPTACREIVKYIVQNASGVFLWVRMVLKLVLEGLQNLDRAPDIIMRLRKLPVDLEGLYEKMFGTIPEHYQGSGSRLFRIFLCATTDSMHTIDLSLAHEGSDFAMRMKVEPLTEVEEQDRLIEMEAWLKARCAGLLEIKKHAMGGSTVRYLHLTTKEFLMKPEISSLLDLRINDTSFDPHESLIAGQLVRLKYRYKRFAEGHQFLPSQALCVQHHMRPGTELCLILKRALYHAVMAEQISQKCYEELLDEIGRLYTCLRHGGKVIVRTYLRPSRSHGWCTMKSCTSIWSSWLKICVWAQLALYIGKKDVLASAIYCCGLSIGTLDSMIEIACSSASRQLGCNSRECIQIRPAFVLLLLRLRELSKMVNADEPKEYWLYCAELDRAAVLNLKSDDINRRYPVEVKFHLNREQTQTIPHRPWKSLLGLIQDACCHAVSRGSALDRDWLPLFVELVTHDHRFVNKRKNRHSRMKPTITFKKWSVYHILFRVFRNDERKEVGELFDLLKRKGATITIAEAEAFPELSGAPREVVAGERMIQYTEREISGSFCKALKRKCLISPGADAAHPQAL
ncbi:hypothetical protein MMC11_004480 [Xylographa trunciseda]|nr:hypothetical protein [Xylographa trunciseda]